MRLLLHGCRPLPRWLVLAPRATPKPVRGIHRLLETGRRIMASSLRNGAYAKIFPNLWAVLSSGLYTLAARNFIVYPYLFGQRHLRKVKSMFFVSDFSSARSNGRARLATYPRSTPCAAASASCARLYLPSRRTGDESWACVRRLINQSPRPKQWLNSTLAPLLQNPTPSQLYLPSKPVYPRPRVSR